jgi:hypothetical protein
MTPETLVRPGQRAGLPAFRQRDVPPACSRVTVKIEKSRDIAVRYLRIRLGKVRPLTALTRRIHQRTICGRSKSCFMTGGSLHTWLPSRSVK